MDVGYKIMNVHRITREQQYTTNSNPPNGAAINHRTRWSFFDTKGSSDGFSYPEINDRPLRYESSSHIRPPTKCHRILSRKLINLFPRSATTIRYFTCSWKLFYKSLVWFFSNTKRLSWCQCGVYARYPSSWPIFFIMYCTNVFKAPNLPTKLRRQLKVA
jgi:hypothetical protein